MKSDELYKRAMPLEIAYERSLKKGHYKTAKQIKAKLDSIWDQFAKETTIERNYNV